MNKTGFFSHLLRIGPSMFFVAALGSAGVACSGSDGDSPPPGGQCTPGTSTGCPAGQICTAEGVCQSAGVQGSLSISAPSARSCEILLESTEASVLSANFGSGVVGAFRARPPRYAVAMTRASDGSFGSDAATLTIEGATSAVAVRKVDCYDAAGAAVSGASATIN